MVVHKPDICDMNFVFSTLQNAGIYITFDENLNRDVFSLDEDGVAYREKLCHIPGFSIQTQRDLDAYYSTEQLQKVGAT